MIENIDNVLTRINEIKSRMREIQSLTHKRPSGKAEKAGQAASVGTAGTVEPAASTGPRSIGPLSAGKSSTGTDTSLPFSELLRNASISLSNPGTESAALSDKTGVGLESIVTKAAESLGVEKNLIKAVIEQESGFHAEAVSPKGAQGLMQLMPSTAESLGVTDAFDPIQNVFGGTKYLRQMLDRYNGNLSLALAAYNAGPGRVDEAEGIPAITETQNYVTKVLANYRKFSM